MPTESLQPVGDIRMLVEGRDCALMATFVHGLANTVLVQAFRSGDLPPTLYVVYREGDMTFDAIVALQPADRRARLDDVLRSFVAGDLFQPVVVTRMRVEIERHFHRRITH